ncbi:MAG: hypothetical protein SV686_16770 [Thermodesulfobacteriota bacterium]|nr:hypothetical protein [Thermodesulfobacteriota bacterium]
MDKYPELPEDQWPEIRKVKASNKTGWSYFENLVKTLHSELGEEQTVKILQVFMRKNARKYVVPSMKSFGLDGKDAWSLASYFKMATGDVIGYKAELSRPEENVVSYKLYPPCLWFPDLDIPPSFCEAMGCFEEEAARIVNPNIEVKHTSLMMAGDPYCEILFIEKE